MGKAIRSAAEGQPCSLRLMGCNMDTETTVLAHIRTKGVGMGRKPDDSMAVFACSNCHDVIDHRSNTPMMDKEVKGRIIHGLAETHQHLLSTGVMVLK